MATISIILSNTNLQLHFRFFRTSRTGTAETAFPTIRHRISPLLHRHTLSQIPRLVHIQPLRNRYIIPQQLKRDNRQRSCKMRVCLRNVYRKVCGLLCLVVTVGCKTHKVSAPALALHHVAHCLLIQRRLGQSTDYKCSVLNQADGAMFQLACCIGLTMYIGNLLELQASLNAYRLINATANKENVTHVSLLGCKPLDALLIVENLCQIL